MSLALQGHPRWPVIVKNSDKTCFINKKGVVKGEGGVKNGSVKTAFLWMFTIGLLRHRAKDEQFFKTPIFQNFKIL